MARVNVSVRFKCREKKEQVDTFAGNFEDIEFYYNHIEDRLFAEISALCPKCGKIHVFKKEVKHIQEAIR